MTTITITDINQLRAGDVATLSYEGHEFTGEVRKDDFGTLWVGPVIVRHYNGDPSRSCPLVSATREMPDLPTKLGSVIANVVLAGGYHYSWAMLVDPGDDLGLSWVVSDADTYSWAYPDQITSWDACSVEVQP